MPGELAEFPPIAFFEACVSGDGQRLLLRLVPAEGGPIHGSFPVSDIENVVTMLLSIAGTSAVREPQADRVRYYPIPISGLAAGELADGTGCLRVTVGNTELMFQIPVGAISEAAQTLLLVANSKRPEKLS